MRIVPKLTASIVAGMCVVLGINGWLRVRRETAAFESERLARHERAAAAMGAAVASAWESQGENAALGIMDAISSGYPSMRARWRPGDAVHDEPRASYVPIIVGGRTRGEVELLELGDADDEEVRSIVFETTKTAAALAALSSLIAFILGELVVGKPVRALAEKARRIGNGNFAEPVAIRTPDELAELAREMNAMSDRLVTALDQVRHADRLATVGKLASGVAHELGTPLNVVSARAEMIAAGRASPEEHGEYARAIQSAAGRMTRIIGQLLQFARRKGVQRQVEDVGPLVRDAVDLLRPLARKRQIVLELDIASVEAPVDRGQLQQVLMNLVMNAVQASPDGAKVRVRLDRCPEVPPADIRGAPRETLCIMVEDEGAGIAPEDLPRIFEPFFTTKEVGEGTGLGLAVSYGIVREHQGWIKVESELGRGSRFTVVLPTEDAA